MNESRRIGIGEATQQAASEAQTISPGQTQSAWQERERKLYYQLLHNFPGIAYQCKLDKEWTMLFISNGVASMSGYPASDFIGNAVRTYESVIHRDDTNYVASSIHLSAAEGRAWDIEYRIIHKDGSILWVQEKGLPVQGQDGCVEYLAGFILDITERKRAEEALRESESRYHSLFDGADDAIFVMRENDITDCNPSASAMFGCSREQFINTSPVDFSPALQPDGCSTLDKAREKISAAYMGETQFFGWRHCRLDGTPFDAEVRLNRVFISGMPHLLAIVRDITAREQAEQALRASEEQYRTLTENALDTIMRFDRDLRHTYVNQNAFLQTGIAVEAFIGKTHEELGFPLDLCALWEAALRRALKTGEVQRTEFMLPNGIWMDWLCVPELGLDGQALGVVTTARDITERKRTEEELKQANLVVENSPAVLFRWKAASGWPVLMASSNVRQFGYSREELMSGKTLYVSLVHPEDLDLISREIEEYSAGKVDQYRQEYRIVTRDGGVRWVDDRTTIIRDENGQVTEYQGIILDITARKQAEEAHKLSQTTYLEIFNSVNDSIYIHDIDTGAILDVNQTMLEKFGYSLEEAGH
jgi:PAS domain S-box-containing protein